MKKRTLLLFLTIIISINIFSQEEMMLKTSIGSNYSFQLVRAPFGDQSSIEIFNSEIIIPNISSSCLPLNDYEDKILLVDWDEECELADKAENAQASGAIAVIICNGNRDLLFPEPKTNNGSQVSIKTFLLDKNDCTTLKLELATNSFLGDIVKRDCQQICPFNTIWSEDFNDGLGNWLTDSNEGNIWIFNENGDCNGPLINFNCEMATPTICNGAMSINSAILDNNGVCQAPCEARLFSPNIKLTDFNIDGLELQFHQSVLHFGSTYFIMLSYDNGLTYPDTFQINKHLIPYAQFISNQKINLGICNELVFFSNQIKIQFYTKANYYFWGIDDICLISNKYSDHNIVKNSWSSAPVLKTPQSQLTQFPLLANVNNLGNTTSYQNQLQVKVEDITTGSNEVFSSQISFDSLQFCQQTQKLILEEHYSPITKLGKYRITYDVLSPDDKYLPNEKTSSDFYITDNVYSYALNEREYGKAYMNSVYRFKNDLPQNYSYSVGTSYFFPNGSKSILKELRFGIDTLPPLICDVNLSLSIYKILDNGLNLKNKNLTIAEENRKLIGKGKFFTNGLESAKIKNTMKNLRDLKFLLSNLDDKDLQLEDSTMYLFVFHVDDLQSSQYLPFLSIPNQSEDENIKSSNNEVVNRYFIEKNQLPFIPTFIAINQQNVLSQKRKFTQYNSRYLFTELILEKNTSSTKDNLSKNISIYPNPASKEINIHFNSAIEFNTYPLTKIEILDLTGKAVKIKSIENLSSQINLDVRNILSGMYILKMTSPDSVVTKKIMIEE